MPITPTLEPQAHGTLFLIGGGEKRQGSTIILDRLVESVKEAAKDRPTHRLVIIPTALKERPLEAAKSYKEFFLDRGLREVDIATIEQRSDADNEKTAETISEAAGIFLTGGDQIRLTSILGGTRAFEALYNAYLNAATVGGTSAGASAMSETMVSGGDVEPAPSREEVRMSPGLGLLPGVVIDQHFFQRRRIGRLVTVIAQNPRVLGLGIDEDTAVEVSRDGMMEVLGSGTVTVFDGSEIGYCNIGDSQGDGPLSLTNLIIHILVAGHRFDTRKGQMADHSPIIE